MESTIQTQNTDDSKYELMERLDEAQIIAEQQGHIIEEYFYVFKEEGKEKTGLSFAGIKYMANLMVTQGHPLSIIHSEIRESQDGNSWLADAVCQDLKTGEKRVGHSQTLKTRMVAVWKDGRRTDEKRAEPNTFAYTQAGSKAERNAMRHFMPEAAVIKAKSEWEKDHGKSGIKDLTGAARIVSDVTKDGLTYTLRDFEGVEVGLAGDELQVKVPAKKLLDKSFMETLNATLGPLGPVWVGKTKDTPTPYYSIKIKEVK